MKYQIIVSNKGTLFETDDLDEANKEFREYKELIEISYGSYAGEEVTLMGTGDDDGYSEILDEWSLKMQNETKTNNETITKVFIGRHGKGVTIDVNYRDRDLSLVNTPTLNISPEKAGAIGKALIKAAKDCKDFSYVESTFMDLIIE